MTHIQIFKSRYKLASIYVIVEADLRVRVGLKRRVGPGSGSRELIILEPSILVSSLPFAMAPVGAESLSSSLNIIKSCKRFLR